MPRATGKDICELFGYKPDSVSDLALKAWNSKTCPFVNSPCTKFNHDQSIVYGVCSVVNATLNGSTKKELIVCPKRLYARQYESLKNVSLKSFGNVPLIVGGDIKSLKLRAEAHEECVIALGQGSGNEQFVNSGGQMSMDWVLVSHKKSRGRHVPVSFVGVEVQSIDITGNYRETWQGYAEVKSGGKNVAIPTSSHGMNWANVHKRLIPQIIRKGNVYKKCNACVGFYFIVPDLVYERFEGVIGKIEELKDINKDNLCIITYDIREEEAKDEIRNLAINRTLCYSLDEISIAFTSLVDHDAVLSFEERVMGTLSY